jgi:hypothetical protein
MNRRFFLTGLVAAPAVIAYNKLMPVKLVDFGNPELKIHIEKVLVTAKTRILKAEYTIWLDPKAYEDYIVQSQQICREIDKQVLCEIRA